MKATIHVDGSSYTLENTNDVEVDSLRALANMSHKKAVTLNMPNQKLVIAAGTPWHMLVVK